MTVAMDGLQTPSICCCSATLLQNTVEPTAASQSNTRWLHSCDSGVHGTSRSPVAVQINGHHGVPEVRACLLAAQRLQGLQPIGPLDRQQD